MSEEPLNTYAPQDAINMLRSYSRHRDFVRLALHRVSNALVERGIVHDASKLLDDEFSGFARINKAARVNKFGSEEYKIGMRSERAMIDLHFLRNSHHPEYPTFGAPDDAGISAREQTFLDVIEMVCDWWGAGRGYGDPRPWTKSAALNFASKGKYLTPEQRWLAEEVVQFLTLTSTPAPAPEQP